MELATWANSNHINWSAFESKGNITYRWRGIKITQVQQEGFWTIDNPTVIFLKIDPGDGKTRSAGNLFQYFTTPKEKAPILRRRWFGPCRNW